MQSSERIVLYGLLTIAVILLLIMGYCYGRALELAMTIL